MSTLIGMTNEESPPPITDPARIRALAHPVRLELLDLLREEGEATATRCAERLEESVASCSFHLRMLAKYGYLERGEQRGREKPWRLVRAGLDVRPDLATPGSLPAVTEVAALSLLRETERVHRFLAQADRESEQWLQGITVTTGSFWATAEEMAELSRQVQQLTSRFAGRDRDPSLRPEGARRGRLFATVNPDPAEQQERSGE